MKKLSSFIITISVLSSMAIISCSKNNANSIAIIDEVIIQPTSAKNIILLIGDGMGLTQITAGTYANGNTSHLERFPVIGFHKSYASDKLITDSAAGATAFSAGVKTYNGAIAVDPDTIPVKTILEEAESNGKASGLVASCSVVHATPASFAAHNKHRKNYEEIAVDLLDADVDVLIGAGLKHFVRRDSDDRDLTKELESAGYQVGDYFNDDIHTFIPDSSKNIAFFTADEEPLPVAQGRDYLLPATNIALDQLPKKSAEGFFLMIEGAQIDCGGHANNGPYVVTEFLEFNKVIGKALDFAKADGNTLVIVTADHETGGMAIQKESTMDSLVFAFTSDYHTGTMIPVFAYGPYSEQFAGIYENISIYNKMRKAFGYSGPTK